MNIIAGTFPALDYVLDSCRNLQLEVRPGNLDRGGERFSVRGPSGEHIPVDLRSSRMSMVEQILRGIRFDFDTLPLLVRGDSKEIRLLTPRIALARLLPTVYSFTYNRYGQAPGTDEVRARFSAELFREMAAAPGPVHLSTAFLGLVETTSGPLIAEEVVDVCNLEIRVKRFHIGSPVHRYRYAERHDTAFGGKPLQRWSRFDRPVVCFDWRHPLLDDDGNRLADEPISDDYAAVWIDDVPYAKQLARTAFEWIEGRFACADLQLIDICFFVDRTGKVIFGEVSPDCMRVRAYSATEAESLDKDRWRSGGTAEEVLERYQRLHQLVFGEGGPARKKKEENHMTDYKNAVKKPTTVKNRRLKMSPGGIITLPVAARKSLRMAKGEGGRVSVAVEGDAVTVAQAGKTGGLRVSEGGQLELLQEARAVLERGTGRHYWIELLDDHGQVKLHPFQ
jgi:hypothetical protein